MQATFTLQCNSTTTIKTNPHTHTLSLAFPLHKEKTHEKMDLFIKDRTQDNM